MNKLHDEWKAILAFGKKDDAIGRWLHARELAFKKGDRSDGYTDAIRREYRIRKRGGLVVL